MLAGFPQPGTAADRAAVAAPQEPVTPQLKAMTYETSLDQSEQPMRVWAPETAKTQPTPLYVHLHSWSGNYLQANDAWFRLAAARGWIILHPNFRGSNRKPDACGSPLARQDVLDAIDWAIDEYQVDQSRIYLAGASGGGHMSMLMAAYYPERFSAVSAWVGISDLAAWYRFHTPDGEPGNYALMTAASCGGAPGASPAVDAEYRARSPLFHIHRAVGLPLELSAGVNDGHTGSVPVRHTLNAFNALARAQKADTVSEEEMEQISTDKKLAKPQPGDIAPDPAYGRAILLRRTAGKAQVTIFDGGHEGLPQAGIAFLARHRRMTRSPATDKPAAE
ncbi:MAG: prolyl oligopeptidase family serine peptidase [Planctomycetaceae bacterium]|nr:prolyl oligopeptidase family serine peptidase [Planctomycetaceae bacterium]